MKKLKLVLASSSPRRKELMGWLGVPVSVIPSHKEEITDKTSPKDVVEDLARLKGEDVKNSLDENHFVVASDTIVAIDGKILGKPKSESHAREMLQMLSGREHEVYTAIYMGAGKYEKVFSMCSKVKFAHITDDLMNLYLSHDEYKDKAGAYGIQSRGLIFVESLQGSYSNVVGFPLSDFIIQMKLFLKEMEQDETKWSEIFS